MMIDNFMTQLQKSALKKIAVPSILLLVISFSVVSKTEKVDKVMIIQQKISKIYELGYDKASPVDMDFIEKKVAEAKIAQKKRRGRELDNLIEQIEIDLKIVEERFKVNQLNQELGELKKQNLLNQNTLDDLKGQIK
jgi:hypothetical protein